MEPTSIWDVMNLGREITLGEGGNEIAVVFGPLSHLDGLRLNAINTSFLYAHSSNLAEKLNRGRSPLLLELLDC